MRGNLDMGGQGHGNKVKSYVSCFSRFGIQVHIFARFWVNSSSCWRLKPQGNNVLMIFNDVSYWNFFFAEYFWHCSVEIIFKRTIKVTKIKEGVVKTWSRDQEKYGKFLFFHRSLNWHGWYILWNDRIWATTMQPCCLRKGKRWMLWDIMFQNCLMHFFFGLLYKSTGAERSDWMKSAHFRSQRGF